MLAHSYRSLSYLLMLVPCSFSCGGNELSDNNGDGVADGIVEPNNVTVVTPTTPMGKVAGEVWDAITGGPLNDVQVVLSGGGQDVELAVRTDTNGKFRFGPIAAGAGFSVRVSRDGYFDAVISDLMIDDAAGNFPTINGALYIGPVRMLPATGNFNVQLVSDAGEPVADAQVTVETAVRYFMDQRPQGSGFASVMSDADGRAQVMGLPDVFRLPPRQAALSELVVQIAPVDQDGDGVADLSGKTVVIPGERARSDALPALIVLEAPGLDPLQAVASNVSGLVGAPAAQISVLGADENIRLVLNKPIDRESIVVDLRDETGQVTIAAAAVVGALGNIITIDPAESLESGAEYNLAVRVLARDSQPQEILNLSSPFFIVDDPSREIVVLGSFVDVNQDGLWGAGQDELRLNMSSPVGRAAANPAFSVELLVALDLNGTSTVGDAPGELPMAGRPRPAPLVLGALEPIPGNGAPSSGFTSAFAPLVINLPVPLPGPGMVNFELRFAPARNGNAFVTTPSGRRVPEVLTGTALFQ